MFEYFAKITRVVDGDTLILDVDLGQRAHIVGKPYRMARINAPELKTPEGVASRDALVAFLGALPVMTRTTTIKDRHDQYDRYLIEVFLTLTGENLNDWMLANGHAVPY